MTQRQTARVVRIGVYVMLVLSAIGAFGLADKLWASARDGTLPVWAALVPTCIFTLFVLVYAVDRWLLVSRRGYPVARALAQIVFTLLVVGLLWPHQAQELRTLRQEGREVDRGLRLLKASDPDFRAAGCELLGLRGDAEAQAPIRERADADASPLVRRVCTEALTRLGSTASPTP